MNGFIVIDKPAGITSHDVVSRVRRILGTRKVGHTGTLDPFATGVLPIAVNDGTKAIPFLDEGIKCYEAIIRLGVVTDTLDVTGTTVREADCSYVDKGLLDSTLARFTGRISQVPPMFSAIKRDGQPLYKLARQGVEVERTPRAVDINSIDLFSFEPPLAGVRIICSRGTYIRSLADDIGTSIGCGATVQELRRTASGLFRITEAITLEALENIFRQGGVDSVCLSPHAALGHLVDIPLSDAGLLKVRHGRSPDWDDTLLPLPLTSEEPSSLSRLSYRGQLVAVAKLEACDDGLVRIIPKRVFA